MTQFDATVATGEHRAEAPLPATTGAALHIRDLVVSYERWGTHVDVLRSLSLDVPGGEWVVLVGQNGAGKSTLLRAIAGQVSFTAGDITLGSVVLSRLSRTGRSPLVYLVQQDPTLGTAATLTCLENLIVAEGTSDMLRRNSVRGRLQGQLASVGLSAHANHLAGLLSGGQRQVLTLLMAGLRPASLLLLDEPLAALDQDNRRICLELMQRLHRAGRTIIQVSHDLDLASTQGDRCLVLKDGRIAADALGGNRSVAHLSRVLG